MEALSFLGSLGAGFATGFVMLTGLAVYQYLRVRDLAAAGRAEALLAVSGTDVTLERQWCELSTLKSGLDASASRANLITASIPTLALLGTCVGFFFAILQTGQLDLGSDPQETLMALMDGGVATALATTVCGQGIYFLLGQAWAALVAGPYEEAHTLLTEALGLVRARLSTTSSLDAPWPMAVGDR